MLERRVRVPERLAEFAPLLGVGLRHLVALGTAEPELKTDPVKQIRIKYDAADLQVIDQLSSQLGLKQPRIIVAALECAARCRLNPEKSTASKSTLPNS